MKNITMSYTLYKFEELSKAAKEKARYSIHLNDWDNIQAGITEAFADLFERYSYGDSCKQCELVETYPAGASITGKLRPYDVWEAISSHHSDEELLKEMEMLLTETYGMDIDVKIDAAYVYGEAHIDTLLQYNAETEEEKELLNEKLNQAISRLEEIIKEDFGKMSEEFLLAKSGLKDFHASDDYLEEIIEALYENEECFLKDGTLFE